MEIKTLHLRLGKRILDIHWYLKFDVYSTDVTPKMVLKLAKEISDELEWKIITKIACVKALRKLQPNWNIRMACLWVDLHAEELGLNEHIN